MRDLQVADDVLGVSRVLRCSALRYLRLNKAPTTLRLTLKQRTASTSPAAASARTDPTTAPSIITGMCCGGDGIASAGALGVMPARARTARSIVAVASSSSATDTTNSHGAAR